MEIFIIGTFDTFTEAVSALSDVSNTFRNDFRHEPGTIHELRAMFEHGVSSISNDLYPLFEMSMNGKNTTFIYHPNNLETFTFAKPRDANNISITWRTDSGNLYHVLYIIFNTKNIWKIHSNCTFKITGNFYFTKEQQNDMFDVIDTFNRIMNNLGKTKHTCLYLVYDYAYRVLKIKTYDSIIHTNEIVITNTVRGVEITNYHIGEAIETVLKNNIESKVKSSNEAKVYVGGTE